MNVEALTARIRSALDVSTVLTCTEKRADWTPPTGYAYDADYDVFIHADGSTWKPDQGDAGGTVGTDNVNALIVQGQRRDLLVAMGVMTTADLVAHIDPDDYTTVHDAQYITIDSIKYDENGITPHPGGGDIKWYEVILRNRL